MRLRDLKFPIAIVMPHGLLGGWSADLKSPSRYRWNLASYYLKGGYDDVTIYDSAGRQFEVELIELRKPAWWRYVLDRLGGSVAKLRRYEFTATCAFIQVARLA